MSKAPIQPRAPEPAEFGLNSVMLDQIARAFLPEKIAD